MNDLLDAAGVLSSDAPRTGWPYDPVIIPPRADIHRFVLTIPGEPVAKGRPKLGTVNGHAMAFTPAKTRRYEDLVRQKAVQTWNRPLIADAPITLQVTFTRGIPASWSRKKREAAYAQQIWPTGRPDLDNMVKAITDGMNLAVFADDALIVRTLSEKRYGDVPGVRVELTW